MNKVLLSIGVIAVIAAATAGTYYYQQRRIETLEAEKMALSLELEEVRGKSAPQASEETDMITYTSPKGVVVTVTAPLLGSKITTPLTVKGRVPGSWSSEGQFIVRLFDSDGTKIGERVAILDGDWMTESQVPFTATLMFSPSALHSGSLVLVKANPSGLPENDDAIEIPVTF